LRLKWTAQAQLGVIEMAEYIGRDDPVAAAR